MKPKGNKKNKSLTRTVGAVEVRQTAMAIEIVNRGEEPVTVRLLEQCTTRDRQGRPRE